MAEPLGDPASTGPYRRLPLGDGEEFPWYMVAFDRKGRPKPEEARDAVVAAAAGCDHTDVFLFSHGWNNSWDDAVRNYEAFITGYGGLCQERGLRVDRPYRPLLVGVSWPSAILVTKEEAGPGLAGPMGDTSQEVEAEGQRALEELAAEVADDQVDRFLDLAGREALGPEEALELAEILAPAYEGDDDVEAAPPPSADELVQLWSAESAEGAEGQALAGFLVKVRDALRQATVWLMKDRAGRVGSEGVGPLLDELLAAAPDARFHLIGHSFGCRVLLSAICAGPIARPVTSVFLLQPAINHLCFAIDAGDGVPGRFRPALDLVEQPILTTFSDNDVSLSRIFHLALRRKSDVGERHLVPSAAPSRYAALGGFGPGGCGAECEQIPIRQVGDPYPLGAGSLRLLGVDGSSAISDHGDISNAATWWALWCQVSQT